MIRNPNAVTVSIEFLEVSMLTKGILHRFGLGEEVAKINPHDCITYRLAFHDKTLDQALKTPQDSASAYFRVTWSNLQTESEDSTILRDSDVVKCTYWQTPIFADTNEAACYKLVTIGSRTTLWYTIYSANGAKHEIGSISANIQVLTDKSGLQDLNPAEIARALLLEQRVGFAAYMPAFKRRYGGIYCGLYGSDTAQIHLDLTPRNALVDKDDYSREAIAGIAFGDDLSGISQFIHYVFNASRYGQSFVERQNNSKFFVQLVCEDSTGIAALEDSLVSLGFHAGGVLTDRFQFFVDYLTNLPPISKMVELADTLNGRLSDFQDVLTNDGILVLDPSNSDSIGSKAIVRYLERITKKKTIREIAFNCRPFHTRLPDAPYAVPLVVFLNFSDETRRSTIDSIRLTWPTKDGARGGSQQ